MSLANSYNVNQFKEIDKVKKERDNFKKELRDIKTKYKESIRSKDKFDYKMNKQMSFTSIDNMNKMRKDKENNYKASIIENNSLGENNYLKLRVKRLEERIEVLLRDNNKLEIENNKIKSSINIYDESFKKKNVSYNNKLLTQASYILEWARTSKPELLNDISTEMLILDENINVLQLIVERLVFALDISEREERKLYPRYIEKQNEQVNRHKEIAINKKYLSNNKTEPNKLQSTNNLQKNKQRFNEQSEQKNKKINNNKNESIDKQRNQTLDQLDKYQDNNLNIIDMEIATKWVFDKFCRSELKNLFYILPNALLSRTIREDIRPIPSMLDKDFILAVVPCEDKDRNIQTYSLLIITQPYKLLKKYNFDLSITNNKPNIFIQNPNLKNENQYNIAQSLNKIRYIIDQTIGNDILIDGEQKITEYNMPLNNINGPYGSNKGTWYILKLLNNLFEQAISDIEGLMKLNSESLFLDSNVNYFKNQLIKECF